MIDGTLVTGFLAFGTFEVNPSALLAEACARRFELLEVSFAAVDACLDRLAVGPATFDRLLMLGVRGRGTRIDFERVARNHVGADPDVRGEVRGPGPIEAGAPEFLRTTLSATVRAEPLAFSDDAGCYLCNYFYYRALRRFPDKRVGFVHVPPLDVLPLGEQRRQIIRLIDTLERGDDLARSCR